MAIRFGKVVLATTAEKETYSHMSEIEFKGGVADVNAEAINIDIWKEKVVDFGGGRIKKNWM